MAGEASKNDSNAGLHSVEVARTERRDAATKSNGGPQSIIPHQQFRLNTESSLATEFSLRSITMKFIATLSAAALIALVSAVPAPGTPSNIEVPADIPDHFPSVQGLPKVVPEGEPLVKRAIAKRATLTVDVWMDSDRRGRHEGLITTTQKCYNLGNGWPDEISSLSVPSGFGCIFYRNNGCNNNEHRLTVPGGNYIANLQTYNFNDIISSYLCYN
ncbi:hypothetical protein B0J11DRAFT_574570 [Dendryphion nanum]|uniref:Uncharacterized protein n=1 Tax=Dendryphion nanum TaxID=256645 RepID=A0A9P9EJG8_9PLEO|nr:hypothetical protein B0J11DRAFT_574570 [Dendryphion nanum]